MKNLNQPRRLLLLFLILPGLYFFSLQDAEAKLENKERNAQCAQQELKQTGKEETSKRLCRDGIKSFSRKKFNITKVQCHN